MSKVLKLNPLYMEKIWGYEKWILSTHKNGISFVDYDPVSYTHMTLPPKRYV